MTTKKETTEKFTMTELKETFLSKNIKPDLILLARHKASGADLIIYTVPHVFSGLSGWSNSMDQCLDARAYAPVHCDDPCCIMQGLTYKERRRVIDLAVFAQKKLNRYLPLIKNTLDALPCGPEREKAFVEFRGVRDALIKASFLQISEYIKEHFDLERACREAYGETGGQIVLLKQKILQNEEEIDGWRAEIEKLENKTKNVKGANSLAEK